MDNYRLIEVAKERATSRANSDTVAYTNIDVIGKVEVTPQNEIYVGEYTDYHE